MRFCEDDSAQDPNAHDQRLATIEAAIATARVFEVVCAQSMYTIGEKRSRHRVS